MKSNNKDLSQVIEKLKQDNYNKIANKEYIKDLKQLEIRLIKIRSVEQ